MTFRRMVRDQVPPAPPDTCELAVFPVAAVPYALGALESRTPRHIWADASYVRGEQLIRRLQLALLCGGLQELLESNNRLYRMLDTAIYGTGYVVQSTDPLVVEPAIPPQRTMGIHDEASILGRMENLKQLLENALNGTETPNYSRPNGIRDLIEQLTAALQETGQLDDEMLAKLAEIAVLVA